MDIWKDSERNVVMKIIISKIINKYFLRHRQALSGNSAQVFSEN